MKTQQGLSRSDKKKNVLKKCRKNRQIVFATNVAHHFRLCETTKYPQKNKSVKLKMAKEVRISFFNLFLQDFVVR